MQIINDHSVSTWLLCGESDVPGVAKRGRGGKERVNDEEEWCDNWIVYDGEGLK
jgi:hypothetical protein